MKPKKITSGGEKLYFEWDNVRKAKPFLKSQSLPMVRNNNYYDLSKLDTLILGKEYGGQRISH